MPANWETVFNSITDPFLPTCGNCGNLTPADTPLCADCAAEWRLILADLHSLCDPAECASLALAELV